MLPYVVSIKKEECEYFAFDISETMIDLGKDRLAKYLDKYGISISLEEWLKKNKISIKVLEGLN